MSVREGEDRLGARERRQVERGLPHGPGLDGIRRRHSALRRAAPQGLRRRRRRHGLEGHAARLLRSTPTTKPNPPVRPASTPASASSKTAATAGSDAERLRRGEECVRSRLPAQALRNGVGAVDHDVEEAGEIRPREHVAAVGARGDDPAAKPRLADGVHVADGALVHLDSDSGDEREHDLVLAVSEAVHGLPPRPGRPARPSGSSMPLEPRNERTPSARVLPSTKRR